MRLRDYFITTHFSHWTTSSWRAAPKLDFILITHVFHVPIIVSGHSRNTCWKNEYFFICKIRGVHLDFNQQETLDSEFSTLSKSGYPESPGKPLIMSLSLTY